MFNHAFKLKDLLKNDNTYKIVGARSDGYNENFIVRKLINDIIIIDDKQLYYMYVISKETIDFLNDLYTSSMKLSDLSITENGFILNKDGNTNIIPNNTYITVPLQFHHNMHFDNNGFIDDNVAELRRNENGDMMLMIWHPSNLESFKVQAGNI